MATKPTLVPRVWASAGVYTTGPFIGSVSVSDPGVGVAAEGHRPGASYPTAAEHENSQQNRVTAFVANWLALGSAAGSADAHIVETDAAGRATIHGVTVNDLANETALEVTSSSAFAPAMSVTCTTGANVLEVSMGNAGVSGVTCNVNAGAGFGFASSLTGSPAGARGLKVTADAGSSGICLEILNDGSGTAASVDSSGGSGVAVAVVGNASGTALDVTAGAGQIAGLFTASGTSPYAGRFIDGSTWSVIASGSSNGGGGFFTGSGTGTGVRALSGTGAGGPAISALARNSAGFGVYSLTHTTATVAVRAGYFEAFDAAGGLEAVANDYYAAIFRAKTTTPTWSTWFVTPQTSYPTNAADGTLTYASSVFGGDGHWVHGSSVDGAGIHRGIWSSLGGFVFGASYDNSATNSDVVTYTILATVTTSGGDSPKVSGGVVRLSAAMRVRVSTAAANGIDIRLRDTTSGVTIKAWSGAGTGATNGWNLVGATTGWDRDIAVEFSYVLPAAGARTFVLEFRRQTAANLVSAQGSLVVTGAT